MMQLDGGCFFRLAKDAKTLGVKCHQSLRLPEAIRGGGFSRLLPPEQCVWQ